MGGLTGKGREIRRMVHVYGMMGLPRGQRVGLIAR